MFGRKNRVYQFVVADGIADTKEGLLKCRHGDTAPRNRATRQNGASCDSSDTGGPCVPGPTRPRASRAHALALGQIRWIPEGLARHPKMNPSSNLGKARHRWWKVALASADRVART